MPVHTVSESWGSERVREGHTKDVPPHAMAYGEDDGKSQHSALVPSLAPLSPVATQMFTPAFAAVCMTALILPATALPNAVSGAPQDTDTALGRTGWVTPATLMGLDAMDSTSTNAENVLGAMNSTINRLALG